MPVEVRELVIKATIEEANQGGRLSSSGSTHNGISSTEEIIKVCVDRVLEIIRDKRER